MKKKDNKKNRQKEKQEFRNQAHILWENRIGKNEGKQ